VLQVLLQQAELLLLLLLLLLLRQRAPQRVLQGRQWRQLERQQLS